MEEVLLSVFWFLMPLFEEEDENEYCDYCGEELEYCECD